MSGSQLISVTELNTLLSDPKLVLLDVRYSLTDAAYGRAAYAEGHIPGARFADLKADVAGVCSGSNGRTPLPDSGRFCVNMRRLGLNYMTTMFEIIIPQAIRSILPALGNEFIMLLKDSSLITVIGGKELLYAAQGIMNRTYEPMFPLLGVAATYLVLVMLFSALLAKFERRLAQSDRR